MQRRSLWEKIQKFMPQTDLCPGRGNGKFSCGPRVSCKFVLYILRRVVYLYLGWKIEFASARSPAGFLRVRSKKEQAEGLEMHAFARTTTPKETTWLDAS